MDTKWTTERHAALPLVVANGPSASKKNWGSDHRSERAREEASLVPLTTKALSCVGSCYEALHVKMMRSLQNRWFWQLKVLLAQAPKFGLPTDSEPCAPRVTLADAARHIQSRGPGSLCKEESAARLRR